MKFEVRNGRVGLQKNERWSQIQKCGLKYSNSLYTLIVTWNIYE